MSSILCIIYYIIIRYDVTAGTMSINIYFFYCNFVGNGTITYYTVFTLLKVDLTLKTRLLGGPNRNDHMTSDRLKIKILSRSDLFATAVMTFISYYDYNI